MKKLLILDQDRETTESILRFLESCHVEAEVTASHPAAIQYYSSNDLTTVIMNVEMPTISVHSLIADFNDISKGRGQRRPPIVFLYRKGEVVTQLQLNGIPGSILLEKPISLADLYRIMEALEVVSFQFDSLAEIEGNIGQYADFLVASRSWLHKVGQSLQKL